VKRVMAAVLVVAALGAAAFVIPSCGEPPRDVSVPSLPRVSTPPAAGASEAARVPVRVPEPDPAPQEATHPVATVPTFRLVDASGRPVLGAKLTWTLAGGGTGRGTTDSLGYASVPSAANGVRFWDRSGAREIPLGEGPTTAVAAGLPEWEIEVRDAGSGELVPRTTIEIRAGWDRGLRTEVEGGRADDRVVGFFDDGAVHLSATVLPTRTLVGEGRVTVTERIAADARRLRTLLVVHPEASLSLRVAMLDGRAATDARIHAVEVADGRAGMLDVTCEPGGTPGTFRVSGIPAAPHVRVRLGVSGDVASGDGAPADAGASGSWSGWTAWLRPGSDTVVDVRLDELGVPETSTVITAGVRHVGRVAPEQLPHVVTVRVLRVDGTPARARVGAVSPVGSPSTAPEPVETDVDGRATVRLAAGRQTLVARGAGLLPALATVRVPAADDILLREPAGRPFDVSFADVDGRAVPFAFARVVVAAFPTANGFASIDADLEHVVGDAQMLPMRADAAGRLVMPRVPEGATLRVTGWLGSARGEVETSDTSARVVLRVSEPK
jgi:hypothetical protein